jgi:transcriptional regulator with XRE-family HTH domain
MAERGTAEIRSRVALLARSVRERRRLSLSAAADRSGVQAQTVARIERGETDVQLGTLSRYLGALGCSLDLAAIDDETGEVVARTRLDRLDGAD